jgi:hypothetical protein
MRYRFVLIILLSALVFSALPRSIQAQEDSEDMCTQLVRQVLTDLGTNCANMEDNTACYGFEKVEATFTEPVEEGFFSEPSDRAELTTLVSLSTAKMDLDASVWGIGDLHVQANIHNAFSKQAIFITVGDVSLENAVEPETALLPMDPISINTVAEANVYKNPDAGSEVRGTVSSGVALQVDGISRDGLWLRAMYFDGKKHYAAWVSAETLDTAVDTSGLPVIDSETRTPMQDFFLRNSLDRPECSNALPPMVVVQVPKDTEADIYVDKVPIRLDSTIILRLTSSTTMRLITLSGMAIIDPDTANEIRVPPGFSTDVCLSEPDDYGGLDNDKNDQIRSCPWSGIEMITEADSAMLGFLTGIPDNLLDEVIDIPIIINPSGVGSVLPVLFFPNPGALDQAREDCDAGLIPANICRRLFY